MRFFRGFVPNLSIAVNLSVLVVVYLDMRNPMMGFLDGLPFLVLIGLGVVCSLITAVLVYRDWCKHGEHKKSANQNSRKNSNNT